MTNDLISREALKNKLNEMFDIMDVALFDDIISTIDNAPSVDVNPFVSITFNNDELKRLVDERVIEAIKNGELVIERPQWIPVSERLPDLFEVVLVTDETGNVFEYERRPLDEEGNVCEEWTFLGRKIIAWMPLPEPYGDEKFDCRSCKHNGNERECADCYGDHSNFCPNCGADIMKEKENDS